VALKTLTVATAKIETSGGDFTVRGLSLSDVMLLVSKDRAAIAALFHKFLQSGNDAALEDVTKLGSALIESAPDLAAEIIAIAADEPDQVDVAKRLSFPAQISALEKIGELTFAAEGGPKKVVETVIRVVMGATDLLGDLQTSQIGSGVSGGK
jgi:hypothetical protein